MRDSWSRTQTRYWWLDGPVDGSKRRISRGGPFPLFLSPLLASQSVQFQRSQTASSHIQAPGAVISLPPPARPFSDRRTLAALSSRPHTAIPRLNALPEACRGQERIWKASPPFHAVTTHPRSWTLWDLWHGGPWPCLLQLLSTKAHSGSSGQGWRDRKSVV